MKAKTTLAYLLLATWLVAAEPPVFYGYVKEGHSELFGLEAGGYNAWVPMGGQFAGWRVAAYDATNTTLTLKAADGTAVMIVAADNVPGSPSASANPPPKPIPSVHSRKEALAALEQILPKGPGTEVSPEERARLMARLPEEIRARDGRVRRLDQLSNAERDALTDPKGTTGTVTIEGRQVPVHIAPISRNALTSDIAAYLTDEDIAEFGRRLANRMLQFPGFILDSAKRAQPQVNKTTPKQEHPRQ